MRKTATAWLAYERAREVVDYDPVTGAVRRRDGKPEPWGGYVKLPATGHVPEEGGFNFIEIDGHRFWVHTVVGLLRRGSGWVDVWKRKASSNGISSRSVH